MIKNESKVSPTQEERTGFFADPDFVRDTLAGMYLLGNGRGRVTLDELLEERAKLWEVEDKQFA